MEIKYVTLQKKFRLLKEGTNIDHRSLSLQQDFFGNYDFIAGVIISLAKMRDTLLTEYMALKADELKDCARLAGVKVLRRKSDMAEALVFAQCSGPSSTEILYCTTFIVTTHRPRMQTFCFPEIFQFASKPILKAKGDWTKIGSLH